MKLATGLALIGLLAMTGIILYAFVTGNFAREGAQLLAMPWGRVSMIDLYTGFVLFSMWTVYREKSKAKAAVWVALMMLLGNWTGALYVFLALRASGGDWQKVFLGDKA